MYALQLCFAINFNFFSLPLPSFSTFLLSFPPLFMYVMYVCLHNALICPNEGHGDFPFLFANSCFDPEVIFIFNAPIVAASISIIRYLADSHYQKLGFHCTEKKFFACY